jgi:hypothetical protein
LKHGRIGAGRNGRRKLALQAGNLAIQAIDKRNRRINERVFRPYVGNQRV